MRSWAFRWAAISRFPSTFWFPDQVRAAGPGNSRARADNDAEKQAERNDGRNRSQTGSGFFQSGCCPDSSSPIHRRSVEFVSEIIERANPSAAAYAVMAMRDRNDYSMALQRINCPTMVISGRK